MKRFFMVCLSLFDVTTRLDGAPGLVVEKQKKRKEKQKTKNKTTRSEQKTHLIWLAIDLRLPKPVRSQHINEDGAVPQHLLSSCFISEEREPNIYKAGGRDEGEKRVKRINK